MLRFRLFGVPIFVQPVFWLTALLLGGNIRPASLLVLWVAVVFVSILVHELGHVTAMRLSRSSGQIVLTAFGGLAIPDGPAVERSRGSAIFISAAGPLAQIILGLLIAFGVVVGGGAVAVTSGTTGIPFLIASIPASAGEDAGYFLHYAVNFFLYISFFWSVLNLAPVYPLDGGQIARTFLGAQPALLISLAIAGVIAGVSFKNGNIYLGALFAWLGFSNVQALMAARRGPEHD